MLSSSLENSLFDINTQNTEDEYLIATTNFSFSKALLPQFEETFVTQPFFLHNTLDSFYIRITWERFVMSAQLIFVTHEKDESNFDPYFGESKIFDETLQCTYFFETQKDNPSYTSCSLLSYSDHTETHLIIFTFVVLHIRHYFENIIPTKLELQERLCKIYNERKFTDVRINVKGKEFLVHKAMITRCSVLYEIIRNNQNKKNKNVVDIADVEPEIFEIILKYLYLGETGAIDMYENNNEFLFNIILTADYYKIIDLKDKLIDVAIKNLRIQNVIHNLIFAEKFNLLNLKENCMKFIRVYGKSISEYDIFKELVESYPKLSADVLLFVLRE